MSTAGTLPAGEPPGGGVGWGDRLWVGWPTRLWDRSPTAGLILADGGWLRAVPGVGASAPMAAALTGLWWGGVRPANQVTYSSSTTIVLVMLGLALLGCGVAAWLWAGFVVGDLVFFDHAGLVSAGVRPNPWELLSRFLVPQLLSYLLLGVLLIGVPLTALVARGAVRGILRPRWPMRAGAAAAAAAAVGAAVQAAAWSQSFPLLIRPLWVWRGRPPDVQAIVPIQEHRWWFALVAGTVAGMVALVVPAAQRRIEGRRPFVTVGAPRNERRPRTARRRDLSAALMRSIAATLLLAGLIESWLRAGIVLLLLTIAFVVQARYAASTPLGRWWLARVPLGLRLLTAVGVAGGSAWLVGRRAVVNSSGFSRIVAKDFGPLLSASVLAIALVALLLPRAAATRAGTDR